VIYFTKLIFPSFPPLLHHFVSAADYLEYEPAKIAWKSRENQVNSLRKVLKTKGIIFAGSGNKAEAFLNSFLFHKSRLDTTQ
jgi:hypothetical protein